MDWAMTAYEDFMEAVYKVLDDIYDGLQESYERLVEEEYEKEEDCEEAKSACVQGLADAYDRIVETLRAPRIFDGVKEAQANG